MATIRKDGWCRIEGAEISDLRKMYQTLSPVPNEQQHVYYSHPEIQLDNPKDSTHSTAYIVKYIKDDSQLGNYSTIVDIRDHWSTLNQNIQAWKDNNPIPNQPGLQYYYTGQPFVVGGTYDQPLKSCVIFYDDSSKQNTPGSKFEHHVIILIDEQATPDITAITAKYKGNEVPIDTNIDENMIEVYAHYDDGNELKITSGYLLDHYDVTVVGSNVFKVYYEYQGKTHETNFSVTGIKKLVSIEGYWDGDQVAYNKTADRRFFVIIANYSDGSQSTVTDFTFPNGNTVTENNQGLIQVYYNGYTTDIQVPPFKVKESRLYAFYNGPDVEVGHEFQPSDVTVRIYYQSGEDISNSYWEDVDINDCTIENSTRVTQEGPNTFVLTYVNTLGQTKSTTFIVNGFTPEVELERIEIQYNGPKQEWNNIEVPYLRVGQTIDQERITCIAYYSNGSVKKVKNFWLSTNIIQGTGINEITVFYAEKGREETALLEIFGIENDTTTANNIFPPNLKNHFPDARIINNRYRGPAEGMKTNDYANMIIRNLNTIYFLFADLETQYNELVDNVAGESGVKMVTLNNVSYMNSQSEKLLNNDHYSTGKYKTEDTDR